MLLQLGTRNMFQRKNYLRNQSIRKFVKTNFNMTSAIKKKAFSFKSQIEKMLQHFEMYNFIRVQNNNTIKFGFNSQNLQDYIKSEWMFANTVLPDQPTFLFKSLKSIEDLKCAFVGVKNLANTVPFSLVEEWCSGDRDEFPLGESTNVVDLINHQFKNKSGTVLKNLTFCSPTDAMELFYKKQQERRIWWKKLSSFPGRFQTSVIHSDESNKSLVGEIQAEFPWGLETVEVIEYLPEICTCDPSFFEIKSKRKKFVPQIVASSTILEKITFTYLCDAYEGLNEETDREVLRFNRKLAPFKVAFAGTGSSAETNKTLEDLALLLAKKIRKLRISVLLLPDVCTTSIEKQLMRNDALGVPFTIILNEKSLKDGIISLRSRDTTLKEQSHVSLIASYVDKIINF